VPLVAVVLKRSVSNYLKFCAWGDKSSVLGASSSPCRHAAPVMSAVLALCLILYVSSVHLITHGLRWVD